MEDLEVMMGLEHLSCEDMLRVLGLFSLEKPLPTTHHHDEPDSACLVEIQCFPTGTGCCWEVAPGSPCPQAELGSISFSSHGQSSSHTSSWWSSANSIQISDACLELGGLKLETIPDVASHVLSIGAWLPPSLYWICSCSHSPGSVSILCCQGILSFLVCQRIFPSFLVFLLVQTILKSVMNVFGTIFFFLTIIISRLWSFKRS